MREIKFRAFQKPIEGFITDKKMREVCDIRWYSNEGVRTLPEEFEILVPIENPSENASHAWCSTRSHYVMQFTGLKDKQGKEIYEGDIVQWGNDVVEVLYQPRSMSFVFGKQGWLNNHFVEEMNDIHEAEVIGNRYENPELLKSRTEPKL
jgi:uncharacterized phage protein (TIGR01671 family)